MSDMENGNQKGKSKKKKSKKVKTANPENTADGSGQSVEQLHTLKQSLPECSVTVTEVKKSGPPKKSIKVVESKAETSKAEVYSLTALQEKILAFTDKNDKTDSSEKAEPIDLNKLSEITVIRTEPNQQENEKLPNNSTATIASDPQPTANNSSEKSKSSQKKKKNKKKKKSISENVEPENNENNNSIPEPTYVKLPSTGDACVLIVSHENFGPSSSDDTTKNNSEEITLRNIAVQNSGFQALPSSISCIPEAMSKDAKKNEPNPGNQEQQNSQESSKVKNKAKENITGKAQKTSNEPKKDSKTKPAKTDMKKVAQNKSSLTSLFSHLPPYKPLSSLHKLIESDSEMPLSFATMGMQSAEGIVSGSDARCISVLSTLEEIIRDYQTPLNKELSRDLEARCQSYVASIGKFRPLSVSMLNAIKYLKMQITSIPPSTTDREAKQNLISSIRKFVHEEIYLAKKAISNDASKKVVDGDVILTYGYSDVVKDLLCQASSRGKQFRVIVVDSKPKLEGKGMLERLLKCGIHCSYMLINGISYVMKEVSKVFIGAHSLLANGYVMSTIGSSQVALIASTYNVPFLVCCETYKFCERVHTDSFDYNEIGDSDSFNIGSQGSSVNKDQNSLPNLKLLNVLYDITPPTLVSMVITEKGALPCTSVPVVLRVRHSGMQE